MKVGVTEMEASRGLLLQPTSFTVEVTDAVEKGVQFTQFLTSVKGTVTCIGEWWCIAGYTYGVAGSYKATLCVLGLCSMIPVQGFFSLVPRIHTYVHTYVCCSSS